MQYSVDNLQLNTCINNFLTLKLNFKYHSSLVEKIRRDKLSGLSNFFQRATYLQLKISLSKFTASCKTLFNASHKSY